MRCVFLSLIAHLSVTDCLRTFIHQHPLDFHSDLLLGKDGSYTLHFNQHELLVDIELSQLKMETYEEESKYPLVGLVSTALKQQHPSLEILYCKEYSLAYSDFQQEIQDASIDPQVELVDWSSVDGLRCLSTLPRSIIHKYNLLHKGIGALILNESNQIFVHQRSSSKLIFPSMYDMFIGGVSSTKESSMQTLFRELKEELGIDLASEISSSSESSIVRYVGNTIIATEYNHCIVDCFVIHCPMEVAKELRFNDGEVEWGQWMTHEELQRLLDDSRSRFVPDGLQVWEALPTMATKY